MATPEEWEALRETPEERQRRRDISADVSSDPRNFWPEEQHLVQPRPAHLPAIEQDLPPRQTVAPAQATPLAAEGVDLAQKFNLDFGGEGRDLVSAFGLELPPPTKRGWWSRAAQTTWGMVQGMVGGALQEAGELPTTEEDVMAERLGGAAAARSQKDVQTGISAKIQGKTREQVEAETKEPEYPELAKKGEAIAKEGSKDIEEAFDDVGYWEKMSLLAAGSVATQLPALAASIASKSPVPSLAAAGAMSGASEYGEQRAAGVEPEKAQAHATVAAISEMATEFLPAKFLTDKAGGPVLQLIFGTMLREIPTELVNTTIQSVNAKYSKNPDMTWREYAQDMLDTAAVTAMSAPALGAAAKGIDVTVGRIGKAPEEEQVQPQPAPAEQMGPEVPSGWLPPGAEGPVAPGIEGAINAPLTSPNIDAPTVELPSEQLARAIESARQIDPETITEEQLRADEELLRQEKERSHAPALPAATAAWTNLVLAPDSISDVGEVVATERQSANAINYENPNLGDRIQREFSFATDTAAVGMRPEQIMPKPGTYVLGKPTDDRPANVLEAMMQTTEQWRQKWMPESTIVLSNEQLLSDSALGWHYSMGDRKHMIVPAVLRKMRDPSSFNVNTQASAFYNLSHEFGHALTQERLLEGVEPAVAGQVWREGRSGVVSDQAIAQLPEQIQAVIREFNALKSRIMQNQMTAQEFVDKWLGPAKKGREFLKELKIAPEAPVSQVRAAAVRRIVQRSRIGHEITSKEFAQKMAMDFFSLDEYLAEQMARYAYAKELDKKSPLGKMLSGALNSLRNYFKSLKADNIVAPGTSFAEWLDGLPKVSRLVQEEKHVVEGKKKAGKKKAKKEPEIVVKTGPEKKKGAKIKVEKVAHNVHSDTSVEWSAKARKQLVQMLRSGLITRDDSMYDLLQNYIRDDNRSDFIDALRDLTGKTIKFQPNTELSKDQQFMRDKFFSPKFKAWFGDWENDRQNASVIREGAFITRDDKSLVLNRETDGPPLVSFVPLHRLQQGENVFHASTLRGAHYIEANMPDAGQEASMVPVVLNIKNPFIVQSTIQPAPTPEELRGQGYDGVIYRNDLEGDVSFVVFDQAQIRQLPSKAGIHFEPDFDAATPEGRGAGRLYEAVKNFLPGHKLLRKALRWSTRATRYSFQLQQMAHIWPDFSELSFFAETNTNFVRYGASRRVEADEILSEWKRIGKRNTARIGKALQAETDEGKHWFTLVKGTKEREGKTIPWYQFEMNTEAEKKLKEYGIDTSTDGGRDLAEFILRTKNNLMDYLNEDEEVLINMMAHRYQHKPDTLNARVREIKSKIHELRQYPFFPQGRFGTWMLTIEKEKSDAGGVKREVVWREAFESEDAWEEAYNRIRENIKPGEYLRKHEMTDKEYPLLSLPSEFLNDMASELALTEEEVAKLAQLTVSVKTEKLLKPYDRERLKIKGYSTDAMRSYANFTWHHSNAQAKLRFRGDFNQAIIKSKARLRALEYSGADDTDEFIRAGVALKAMEGTKDYIMSPPNEANLARSAVSLMYLGLNVKTAALNFYGLVTVWSDLQDKYGTVKGQAMFARAIGRAAASVKGDESLPPELRKALGRAIQEGVLSQSYAYHLAGMANQGTLARMPGAEYLGKITQPMVDFAMMPFRLTELATRRVSFLAAMEEMLDRQAKGTLPPLSDPYTLAVQQVNKLQNDYSHGNRVPFMRGQKGKFGWIPPMATVFMSFAQHMAWHGFGGYELGVRRQKRELVLSGQLPMSEMPKWHQWGYGYTARIWMLTLLMAGYEGLPGMENIIDLLEIVWRFVGKKPLRQELREFVKSVGGDPEFWSRGLAQDVLGFDVSRSVGFGRLVPGTDQIVQGKERTAAEVVGGLAFNLMGPTGGLIKFGLTALGNNETWQKDMEKFPGGLGGIWAAYNWWDSGGPTAPNGAKIALEKQPDGTMKPRDLTATEIIGKGLGFNPTIVSRNRAINWERYDTTQYYETQRAGLKRNYALATLDGDKEALQDVRKAITRYHENLPDQPEYRKMKILPSELSESVKRMRTERRKAERGLPRTKRDIGVSEDVRRSYEPE